MDFETTDWELEAARVVRAFEVEEDCAFVLTHYSWGDAMAFRSTHSGEKPTSQGAILTVDYTSRKRNFHIYGAEPLDSTWIMIPWHGSSGLTMPSPRQTKSFMMLVKGLANLDLLTPRIQAAMKISISHHQKLEWALESEARYGL